MKYKRHLKFKKMHVQHYTFLSNQLKLSKTVSPRTKTLQFNKSKYCCLDGRPTSFKLFIAWSAKGIRCEWQRNKHVQIQSGVQKMTMHRPSESFKRNREFKGHTTLSLVDLVKLSARKYWYCMTSSRRNSVNNAMKLTHHKRDAYVTRNYPETVKHRFVVRCLWSAKILFLIVTAKI